MTITLIEKDVYETLLTIYLEQPKLTLQNEGYQYIAKSELNERELLAFQAVHSILSKCIRGFTEFNNFRFSTFKREPQVRFQYNWSEDDPDSRSFIGVGYISIRELHEGFDRTEVEKNQELLEDKAKEIANKKFK